MASVFVQSFEVFKVIVVDDGSIDDGPVKVLEYSDLRLRMVRQQNADPGAASNCEQEKQKPNM